MKTIDRIQDILRDFFSDDTIVVSETTVAADVQGWDSLANVQIILAIENAFSLEFSLEELTNFKCIGDIIKCIEKR